LDCPIEFGAGSVQETHLQLVPKISPGNAWGPNEAGGNISNQACVIYAPALQAVSQTTYAPYDIDSVTCYAHRSVWHRSVMYDIKIRRMSSYWSLFFIVPAIIFTYMSFAVFHMAFKIGERLGFGVTLVLTTEVSKQTMAAYIPICGEILWIEA
jgi:hypothetical protein